MTQARSITNASSTATPAANFGRRLDLAQHG